MRAHPRPDSPPARSCLPMRSTFLFAVLIVAVVVAVVLVVQSATATRRAPAAVGHGHARRRLAQRRHRALPGRRAAALADRRERSGRAHDARGDRRARGGPADASPPTSSSASARTTRRPQSTRFAPTLHAWCELVGPDRCVIWATIWRDGRAERRLQRRAARGGRGATAACGSSPGPSWSSIHPELARRATASTATRPAIASGPGASPRRCDSCAPAPAVSDAMTRIVALPTGADLRLRNEGAPRAVVLVNGGSAKAVPGTWSATSELLATELAPRFPDARVRRGALPRQDVERARLLHGGRPRGARSRRAPFAARRLLDGRGRLDRGRRSPGRGRGARARAVDSRPAPARRPPRQAARRAPRALGPLSARHSRA